jgi:integrase
MLIDAVQTYLAVRRSVGFALRWQEDALRSFATFSAARGQHTVSVAVAHEWAGSARQKAQRARRLGVVIRFARYLHAEDQRHEVPPAIFGAEKSPRPSPYILTTEQTRQVVDTAAQTGSPTLRRATYSTSFALLACTGLRVSEAIRLRVTDITTDGLLIRSTKFRKSRLVPLHATARAGLERYLQQRRLAAADDHVFVSLRGKPLLGRDVITAFRSAVSKAGFPARFGSRPTPKSLRHTFATRALHTSPDGRDAATRHMVALATYLGHKSVAETYWYLEAVPELMRDIADRAEGLATGAQP